MKKIPFIIAIVIAAIICFTAADRYITPSQASTHFWNQMTEQEQSFYLIGYLTANTVWSRAVLESDAIEPITEPMVHVYNLLAPASSYQWPELIQMIDAHLEEGTPIWQVIHAQTTIARPANKGDL